MKGEEVSVKVIEKVVFGREKVSVNVLGFEYFWCCSSSMEVNGC